MTPGAAPGDSRQRGANLLLITIDSWRQDHAGFLGMTAESSPTPHLDQVAGDSVVFENAAAAGIPTYYSFPSIMASRYPLQWGRGVIGLAPDEETLATSLARSGLSTAGFVAAAVYASHHFGYDNGFGTFDDFLQTDISPSPAVRREASGEAAVSPVRRMLRGPRNLVKSSPVAERLYATTQWHLQFLARWRRERQSLTRWLRCPPANVMVDRARHWLDERGDRQGFLWLHLMDPHHPYFPPREAMEHLGLPWRPRRMAYVNDAWMFFRQSRRREAKLRAEARRLYQASVRWVDIQLDRLFCSLREWGLWDRTVTVVTADHGEEFDERGRKGHQPWSLSPELVHVPLLIRIPGVSGRRVASPFSLLDLAPTVLESLELPAPESFAGRSRFEEIVSGRDWDDPVITEMARGCTNPWVADQRLRPRAVAASTLHHRLTVDFETGTFDLVELGGDHGSSEESAPERNEASERQLLKAIRSALFAPRTAAARSTALRASAAEIAQRMAR